MLRSNCDVAGLPAASTSSFQPESAGCRADAAPVAIVGCGNAARALTCHLQKLGFPVRLLVRCLDSVGGLSTNKRLSATGKLDGEYQIEFVTESPEQALADTKTLFVATVTTAYPEIASRLAPLMRSGQEIVLFSSKFAGVLEFERILKSAGAPEIPVLETDSLFASRTQEDGSIWVRGIKQWTLFSAADSSRTAEHASVVKRYFPGLEPADNVVQRGLTDFGALAHPLTMIANMNKVDSGTPFLFYREGFTDRTIALMERLEEEFRSVASAYGTTLIPMPELLNRYYGCDNSSLLAAMQSVPNYSYSQAPATLNHRFIEEDVSCSLVPIQQLARKAGLVTPIVDSVIGISSVLLGVDFCQTGRNLERLGWAHLTHEEILERINA